MEDTSIPTIGSAETKVFMPREHDDHKESFNDCVRVYPYSPGLMAIQVRGKTRTKAARLGYAHGRLNVDSAKELVEALQQWIREQGAEPGHWITVERHSDKVRLKCPRCGYVTWPVILGGVDAQCGDCGNTSYLPPLKLEGPPNATS